LFPFFATGVEFSKKFETVLMGYSGAGEKLIHEKTRGKKSRDTAPLVMFGQRHSSFRQKLQNKLEGKEEREVNLLTCNVG
jgi:hypothetical protein